MSRRQEQQRSCGTSWSQATPDWKRADPAASARVQVSPLRSTAAQFADIAREGLGGELQPLREGQVRSPGARHLFCREAELDGIDGRLDDIAGAVGYHSDAQYPAARSLRHDLHEAPRVTVDERPRDR